MAKVLANNPPQKVRALHIIIKHKNSRNKVTRNKQKQEYTNPKMIENRSEDEAEEILLGYLKEINKAKDKKKAFMQMAVKYSDCSSHARGGDLGSFAYKDMQKAFSDAAFNLDVNEITQSVVVSGSGSHLIMRIE